MNTAARGPDKIAVVGITGSGKSVVARTVAERLDLPLFHMDTLFWQSGWKAVPEAEYIEAQAEILRNNERWVIDGYVDVPLAERLRAADLIVYLDFTGTLCAWRYLQRWLKHRKSARPELPEDCLERFSIVQFWNVFTRAERPAIERACDFTEKERIERLKSPAGLERYLAGGFERRP